MASLRELVVRSDTLQPGRHPDLERFVAQRMGATTYQADSSHVPMPSQPGLVLDVIRAAVAGI
jgi:hypothetical protein